jgi:hypothetical protein
MVDIKPGTRVNLDAKHLRDSDVAGVSKKTGKSAAQVKKEIQDGMNLYYQVANGQNPRTKKLMDLSNTERGKIRIAFNQKKMIEDELNAKSNDKADFHFVMGDQDKRKNTFLQKDRGLNAIKDPEILNALVSKEDQKKMRNAAGLSSRYQPQIRKFQEAESPMRPSEIEGDPTQGKIPRQDINLMNEGRQLEDANEKALSDLLGDRINLTFGQCVDGNFVGRTNAFHYKRIGSGGRGGYQGVEVD